eukprot:scaffold25124_cov30-Phaeocystis_antarctica.AAC.1
MTILTTGAPRGAASPLMLPGHQPACYLVITPPGAARRVASSRAFRPERGARLRPDGAGTLPSYHPYAERGARLRPDGAG